MDIIRRGFELTKTMKNAARFKEIIRVLTQNGLDEFIIRSGLHKIVPDFALLKKRNPKQREKITDASWASIIGRRLKKSFEELGPSFIKIGQLLSTREDIFPPEFIEQMKWLRDRAKGIPFEEALKAIDKSLGQSHQNIFESIDPEPIGTASLGLVYRGCLKSGEHVVIKIKRPGIEKIISMDLAIINFIVERLEKSAQEIKYFGSLQTYSRVWQSDATGTQL